MDLKSFFTKQKILSLLLCGLLSFLCITMLKSVKQKVYAFMTYQEQPVSAEGLYEDKIEVASETEVKDDGFILTTAYPKPQIDTRRRVSVRDCGAVGDGVTDDTAAIRAAIKKAAGTSLYIPTGTYLVSKTLTIPANTVVFGDGDSSVILACPGFASGKDLVKFEEASNIVMTKVCLSGNSSVNTREMGYSAKDGIHLLDIWGCSDVTVYDCTFADNVYCAVRMIWDCQNMAFYECRFRNVDCAVSTLGSGNLDNLHVEYCTFDGHKNSESISLYGQGHYSNIVINKNVIKNKFKGHAIFAGANGGTVSDLTISGNTILNDCVGIKIENTTRVKLFGNNMNVDNPTALDPGKGIDIRKSSDIEVYSNIISNTRMQALYIGNCLNVSIHDNNFTECGRQSKDFHYMDIRGDNSNIDIYSNTFIRKDSSLSPYVFVSHSRGDVMVHDNKFSRGCKILLSDDSAGMTIQGNSVPVNNMGSNHSIQ